MSDVYNKGRLLRYNPYNETEHVFFPVQELHCEERYQDFKGNITPPVDHQWIKTEGKCMKTALKIDMQHHQSWVQPRFDNYHQNSDIGYGVFHISRFDEERFQQAATHFWENQQDGRTLKLNTPSLPFILLTTKIPKDIYELFILGKNRGGGKINVDLSKYSKSDFVDVPTHFIVSDGHYSAMVIAFPIEEEVIDETTTRFNFDGCKPHTDLIKFWKTLPVLYSDEAQDRIIILRRFLREMYGIHLDLFGLDLGALAVVSGCKLDNYDMFSLSNIVVGRSLEKGKAVYGCSNTARPGVFKSDARMIMHRLHVIIDIYNVLIGHIIRTSFPDPVCTLTAFKLTQFQFIGWFTEFISEALKKAFIVNYQREEFKETQGRLSMTRSLNSGDPKIIVLAKLCSNVPALQYGGPRYLHHVRKLFINQHYAIETLIKSGAMTSYVSKIPDVMSPLNTDLLMFGRSPQNYSGESLTPGKYGLQPSKFIHDVVSPDSVFDNICRLPAVPGRYLTLAYLEWGRLNPSLVSDLFDQLNRVSDQDLSQFWIINPRLYTGLRDILDKLFDNSKKVERLEFLITHSRENVLRHQIEQERKCAKFYKEDRTYRNDLILQQHRVDLLNHHTSSDQCLSAGLHQAVYNAIPGKNNFRNKKIAAKRKARINVARRKYPDFQSRTEKRIVERLSVLQNRVNGGSISTDQSASSTLSQYNYAAVSLPESAIPGPSSSYESAIPGPSSSYESAAPGPSSSYEPAAPGPSSSYEPAVPGPSRGSVPAVVPVKSRLRKLSAFDLRNKLNGQKPNSKGLSVSFQLHTSKHDGGRIRFGQEKDLRSMLPKKSEIKLWKKLLRK